MQQVYGDQWCLNIFFRFLILRGEKIMKTGFCKHHMQLFSFLFNQEFGDLCKTVSKNLNSSPNHRCIVFCARPGGRHWGNLKSQKNSSSHQKTSTKSHGYIPSLSITPLRYINHLLYLLWRQLHALFFHLWGFFSSFLNLPMPILASGSSGNWLRVLLKLL